MREGQRDRREPRRVEGRERLVLGGWELREGEEELGGREGLRGDGGRELLGGRNGGRGTSEGYSKGGREGEGSPKRGREWEGGSSNYLLPCTG